MSRASITLYSLLAATALLLHSEVAGAQGTPSQPPAAQPTPSQGTSAKKATEETSPAAGSDPEAGPWYEHRPWMPKDPPPLPRRASTLRFVPISARYEAHSFLTGSVTGAGSVMRIVGPFPSTTVPVEGFIGVYLPNGAMYAGLGFFRHWRYTFIPELMRTSEFSLNIASAHFEVAGVGLAGVPFTLNAIGSIAGIRASHCSTRLSADLRPIAGIWGSPTAGLSGAVSWGVSLNVSYVFTYEPSVDKPKPVEDTPKPKEDEDAEQEARARASRCTL